MKQELQKRNIVRNLFKKILRNFIDIFILFSLAKTDFLSGYDILTKINDRYMLLLSPGTVYSILYRLEREGLIEGQKMDGKRVYRITEKGRKHVEYINKNRWSILKSIEQLITTDL
ncbi:hypothetical protein DRO34_00140 [Candidatus Bathyarchaeota archaeon]|nr:MAG: hypothetical protein DRO34_00140 [Candidatus Bathyarchaeota archaeon]